MVDASTAGGTDAGGKNDSKPGLETELPANSMPTWLPLANVSLLYHALCVSPDNTTNFLPEDFSCAAAVNTVSRAVG